MAIDYTGTTTVITVDDATDSIDVSVPSNTLTVTEAPAVVSISAPNNIISVLDLNDPSAVRALFSGADPIQYDVVTGEFSLDDLLLYAKFDATAPLQYDNTSGLFSIDDLQLYAKFDATAPLQYDNTTGLFSIDENALFSGKTTDDLTEGVTNLYYTDQRVNDYIINNGLDFNAEKVDDRVAVLIQNGTGITFTYDDVADTLTPTVSLTPFDTDALSEGATNLYYTDQRVNDYIIANGLDFNAEKVDDQVALLLQDGPGITFNYLDGSGTLTPTINLSPFTTTDLAEGTNLYYTDNRVATALGSLTTNIISTQSVTASKFFGDGSALQMDTLVAPDTVSGDVTIDRDLGSVHQLNVFGDITSFTFTNMAVGESVSMIITQDTFGGHILDVDNVNWTDTWTFIEDHKDLTVNPNAVDLLTVLKTGTTTYLAALSHTEDLPDVIDDIDDVVITAAANGEVLTFDGVNWVNSPVPTDSVTSVNSQTGVVVLDTDDIAEGITNQYYTEARFDTSIGTKTTTDLAEGTNLYYTDARFDTRLGTKSTTDLTEGTNLYYTDARARASISVSGDLSYNSTTGVISYTDSATPQAIDDLTDVVVTTPATNEVLTYDGANWVNAVAVAGASAIDDLTDVVITTPATNEVLSYDGANWINIASSGGMTQQQFNDWFDTRFAQTLVYDGGYSGPHDGGSSATVYDANDYYINGGTA